MKASIVSVTIAVILFLVAGVIASALTSGFVTFILGGLGLGLVLRFACALEDALE